MTRSQTHNVYCEHCESVQPCEQSRIEITHYYTRRVFLCTACGEKFGHLWLNKNINEVEMVGDFSI
jgi:hypothetical protein